MRKVKIKAPPAKSTPRKEKNVAGDNYLHPRFLRVHHARIGQYWTWPEHINQEHEWVVVHNGKIRSIINNSEFTAGSGDFYFVEPGQAHCEKVASGHLELVTLRFDLLDKNDKSCDFIPPMPPKQLIRGFAGQLTEHFERIIELGGQEKPGTDQIIESIILQMIWLIRQRLNQGLPKPCPERISRRRSWMVDQAIKYMQQNLHRPLPISELSQFCCASRHHLAHVFKKTTGISPLQYALQLRMEKAQRLLADHSFQVKQVAQKMGFDDPFYFSRLFKKVIGLSPRAFRNQLKNN